MRRECIMISGTSETRALKKVFQVAYYVKEWTAIRVEWQSRIMRRIRQVWRLKSGGGFWSALENLVWGLAPGSSILIVALAILCVRMYLNLGHDYLSTMTAHSVKVALAELFGYEG
jgi:hypothetical protein